MSDNNSSYTRGFVFGAIIGGAVGAITALLLAPKSGAELRSELAEKSKVAYDKASDFVQEKAAEMAPKVEAAFNEGRFKAQTVVDAAKRQADEILSNADSILTSAKLKANSTRDEISGKFENLREATKAGIDTFKQELNS
jgi:gas vesicle protein